MEKKRTLKIRCNCGRYFEDQIVTEDFTYPIMVCPGCDHKTFSIEQAKEYVRRERTHKALSKKRKVIKIGNALGVTLPKILQEYGIHKGTSVTFGSRDGKKIQLVFG